MNENTQKALEILKEFEKNENSADITKWSDEKVARGIFKFVKSKIGDKMTDSTNPSINTFIDNLLSIHIQTDSVFLTDWVKKAYEISKKQENFYAGDADVYLNLVYDTPKIKAFVVKNTCSCADVVNWLVVWETSRIMTKIHVRELYPDSESDYPSSDYPSKLNLQFFKDRNFNINYIQEYHMTKNGGVYGDSRDKGYVISKSMRIDEEPFDLLEPRYYGYFYRNYVNFSWSARMLYQAFDEKSS